MADIIDMAPYRRRRDADRMAQVIRLWGDADTAAQATACRLHAAKKASRRRSSLWARLTRKETGSR